jgi:anti-sigma B factor antagonist
MMSELIVEIFENIAVVRVQLERATLSNAGNFRDRVNELIQSGKKELIIDCRNVEFMDSTFLGSLVVSLKKVNSIDGDMCLIIKSKDSPIWIMFEATRMFKVFNAFFTLEEALESFKK